MMANNQLKIDTPNMIKSQIIQIEQAKEKEVKAHRALISNLNSQINSLKRKLESMKG